VKKGHSEHSSTGLSHSSRRKKAVTKLRHARQPELPMFVKRSESWVNSSVSISDRTFYSLPASNWFAPRRLFARNVSLLDLLSEAV
jgi:hypothetical protein